MIRLSVWLYPDGCLQRFSASGHAEDGKKGRDIVCAAVTALLRTAGRLLAGQPDLNVDGESPNPGSMRLFLHPPGEKRREWVRGVTDVLVSGVTDLQKEFPGRLSVEINGLSIGED